MDEMNDLEDFDSLTSQGDQDQTVTPDKDEGKQQTSKDNKAFAEMRLREKKAIEEAAATKQQLESLQQQVVGLSQPAPAQIPGASMYDDVLRRATAASQKYTWPSPEEQTRWIYMTANMALTHQVVNEAMAFAKAKDAPTILEQTLSGLTELGLTPEDRQAISKRIESVSEYQRGDPEVIQKEVNAYIGENLSRFVGAGKKKSGRPGYKTRGRQTHDGSTPVEGAPSSRENMVTAPGAGNIVPGTSSSAAAAAQTASDLSVGTPGLKIGVPEGDRGKQNAPTLTKEDFATMRKSGLDPTNPDDVDIHVDGKKMKESRI